MISSHHMSNAKFTVEETGCHINKEDNKHHHGGIFEFSSRRLGSINQ